MKKLEEIIHNITGISILLKRDLFRYGMHEEDFNDVLKETQKYIFLANHWAYKIITSEEYIGIGLLENTWPDIEFPGKPAILNIDNLNLKRQITVSFTKSEKIDWIIEQLQSNNIPENEIINKTENPAYLGFYINLSQAIFNMQKLNLEF